MPIYPRARFISRHAAIRLPCTTLSCATKNIKNITLHSQSYIYKESVAVVPCCSDDAANTYFRAVRLLQQPHLHATQADIHAVVLSSLDKLSLFYCPYKNHTCIPFLQVVGTDGNDGADVYLTIGVVRDVGKFADIHLVRIRTLCSCCVRVCGEPIELIQKKKCPDLCGIYIGKKEKSANRLEKLERGEGG